LPSISGQALPRRALDDRRGNPPDEDGIWDEHGGERARILREGLSFFHCRFVNHVVMVFL
jgi:hypothetical protein